ncbi:MAG: type II secretion system minor pseudopilin GspH [Pseudomonadales bacterium]
MPTSTTPTCNARGTGGFTLLELLVVIVLVGILTGTVILGFTGADQEQRLKGSAEQLAYRIELARQYALQRNREWGLFVEPDEIRFAEFDPEQQTWVEQTQRPFGDALTLDNLEVGVEAEGLDQLTSAEREKLPKVILFSSGEVTPFTLTLRPLWDALPWTVTSDGLSRVSAVRAEP